MTQENKTTPLSAEEARRKLFESPQIRSWEHGDSFYMENVMRYMNTIEEVIAEKEAIIAARDKEIEDLKVEVHRLTYDRYHPSDAIITKTANDCYPVDESGNFQAAFIEGAIWIRTETHKGAH